MSGDDLQCLQADEYVLRRKVVALHFGETLYHAQLYSQCINIIFICVGTRQVVEELMSFLLQHIAKSTWDFSASCSKIQARLFESRFRIHLHGATLEFRDLEGADLTWNLWGTAVATIEQQRNSGCSRYCVFPSR